ncbi:FKBP-type peptidyl-prolyl cis-trans isomerase [soil metagenome]
MKKSLGVVGCCLSLFLASGCDGGKGEGKFGTLQSDSAAKAFEANADVKTLPSGIKYVDTKVGTGAEAEADSSVAVHYSGVLVDGTPLDSSLKKGVPITKKLGTESVIKGWDLGIPGMKVGGKRKLLIPSGLAYGSMRYGPIPPNSDLIFDIELLQVQ